MKKNDFNPDLMISLELREFDSNSNGITIEIFKHFQSNLDKELDNVFRFTARIVNFEKLQKAATRKMKELQGALPVQDADLMVYVHNGQYYLDESFFSQYADEDGLFKSLDALEKSIKFWLHTVQIVMQTEPSN